MVSVAWGVTDSTTSNCSEVGVNPPTMSSIEAAEVEVGASPVAETVGVPSVSGVQLRVSNTTPTKIISPRERYRSIMNEIMC